MYKVTARLAAAGRAGIASIVLSGIVWAQSPHIAPEAVPSQDVFAAWQASVNDAADRALAAAVAGQPWMKSADVAVRGTAPSVNSALEPLARFRAGVERVQQLRPTIEPILRQEGVPEDLIAVVLVESGGQITAVSPKGAAGLWQFMPDTARRYGLTVGKSRDDRLDIQKSTRAAARYLRELYGRFGNWSLALAAYNAGEALVQSAVIRAGSRDFTAISNTPRLLPAETRSYVPAVHSAIQRVGGHPGILTAGERLNSRIVYALGDTPN